MNQRQAKILRELAAVAGFALIAGGLAGYDWRVSVVVSGMLLMISGVYGMRRG